MNFQFLPRNFLLLSVLWICHFFIDFMLGIWPAYKTVVEVDLAVAGFIAACTAFLGEGFQLITGSLSDKGFRKVLIILGILLACSNTLLSYTQNIVLIFILCLASYLGSGAFHPSAAGLVGSLTENKKALFMAVFTSGGYIGFSLSQLGFSHVYNEYHGHTLLLAIPPLLLIAVCLLYPLKSVHDTKEGKLQISECFRLFTHRNLRRLYFVQICVGAVMWALVFLLPDLLQEKGFEPWVCFGGGHLWCMLGASLMIIPAGYLADRFTARKVIIVASLLGAIFYYYLLFQPIVQNSQLFFILFCVGALISLVNPISVALGNQMMPQNPGLVSGFLMGMAWCVAECIGPGLGGLLTKLFDDHVASKSLAILGIGFLGTLISAINLENLELKTSIILSES